MGFAQRSLAVPDARHSEAVAALCHQLKVKLVMRCLKCTVRLARLLVLNPKNTKPRRAFGTYRGFWFCPGVPSSDRAPDQD